MVRYSCSETKNCKFLLYSFIIFCFVLMIIVLNALSPFTTATNDTLYEYNDWINETKKPVNFILIQNYGLNSFSCNSLLTPIQCITNYLTNIILSRLEILYNQIRLIQIKSGWDLDNYFIYNKFITIIAFLFFGHLYSWLIMWALCIKYKGALCIKYQIRNIIILLITSYLLISSIEIVLIYKFIDIYTSINFYITPTNNPVQEAIINFSSLIQNHFNSSCPENSMTSNQVQSCLILETRYMIANNTFSLANSANNMDSSYRFMKNKLNIAEDRYHVILFISIFYYIFLFIINYKINIEKSPNLEQISNIEQSPNIEQSSI